MTADEAPPSVRQREVNAFDEQRDVPVDLPHYASLARLVLDEEKVRDEAELALMFVDETAMTDLHERFLGLEGPTDVLAFPMDDELIESGRQPDQGGRGPGAPPDENGDDAPLLVGDVVICPAVAARQAGEGGHPVEEEMELLVVHGVLHLLDYDHAEDEETARMQQREREILAKFRG